MININLEEIKQKTSKGLSKYNNLHNVYGWKDIVDLTEDKRFENIPLTDIEGRLRTDDKNLLRVQHDAPIIPYVCFGRFNQCRLKKNSRIVFTITPYKELIDSNTNNHCWMNIHQVNYWIETMRDETGLDFFYEVVEKKDKFIITFDFKKLRKIQMKYVLFWTRYLYEYPSSFVALDAMLLKHQEKYKNETLQNLLTLCSICQVNNKNFWINRDQNITVTGNFIQKELLSKRLSQGNRTLISSMFSPATVRYSPAVGYKFLGETVIPNFIGHDVDVLTGETWIDNTERFKIYDEYYPRLKQLELCCPKEQIYQVPNFPEIDLEDIKERTNIGISRFYGHHNEYRWTEYYDLSISSDPELKNQSLLNFSEDVLRRRLGVASFGKQSIHPCFGSFIYNSQRLRDKSAVIFTSVLHKVVLKQNYNNHCWMTLDQLNYWISIARQDSGINFNYKIVDLGNIYEVVLELTSDLSWKQVKYILFWLRYAFETPASYYALDALLLKRDYYPEESLQNLLTLVSVCHRVDSARMSNSQCLTTYGEFIQTDILQKRIASRSNDNVSSIFNGDPSQRSSSTVYGKLYLSNYYDAREMTGESWLNHPERFDVYQKAYKLMKEREIKR